MHSPLMRLSPVWVDLKLVTEAIMYFPGLEAGDVPAGRVVASEPGVANLKQVRRGRL